MVPNRATHHSNVFRLFTYFEVGKDYLRVITQHVKTRKFSNILKFVNKVIRSIRQIFSILIVVKTLEYNLVPGASFWHKR